MYLGLAAAPAAWYNNEYIMKRGKDESRNGR